MRYADWGERSPRWAGIRSQEIDVSGTKVHYLSAGKGQGGLTHLLIHPMAGSASMWTDTIAELSAHGPVIAPDLPGSVFGHTDSPHPRASKAELGARFLRAFTGRMGLKATNLWRPGEKPPPPPAGARRAGASVVRVSQGRRALSCASGCAPRSGALAALGAKDRQPLVEDLLQILDGAPLQ
ncbi:hypothetical protein Misp01_20790 [Microtetraspora sp. NBRC 13810]|nr:hypothetical protein Misp01_20790 [Microtetraspora sp. NBRC 13810]